LKAVVYYYDTEGEWSVLGQRILRALQLNEADDLIPWVQSASKPEIAALALEVFQAAADREAIARDILAGAAGSLVNDAVACARNLAGPGTPVQFVFAGSVLLQQPRFAKKISSQLHQRWPKAVITPLQRESVWGAVELALQFGAESKSTSVISEKPSDDKVRIGNSKAEPSELARARVNALSQMLVGSPTERRNPSSMNLDRMPLPQAIQLMLREDAKIPGSIRQERKKIERAIGMIVRAFRQEGRLFYVGAGSSGRLGVLDASECPPTFQAAPSMVQGIIAGGQRALWEAVEGAEDDPDAGARAIEFRGVSSRDVVVGIAASGSTPFVWGALNAAKNHKALTVLLCFNPQLQKIAKAKVDLVIAPDVGPEILTGSTRLKAGTATKIILNMFTTLAMVRLGKVLGNLMIDLKPSNAKLRDRATRIVQQLTGADYARARSALEKAGWQIKRAIRQQRRC
jgi:N-acetylmuramic acid 6-phosphate etherase